MGITNFDIVQANQFLGPTPQDNPFGNTFFVSTTGSDGNTGRSPQQALLTIAAAIAAGAAGDNIVIAPGTYSSAAALVPKAQMTIRAAVINPRNPTVKITGTSAITSELLQVDVGGCSFYGIEFLAGDNALTNLVDLADAADVAGVWFHSCVFNGADKTSVAGIQMDDGTFIPTGVVIENCLFRDLTGTHIDVGVLGMPYALIRNNTFALDVNSGTAIALADTGGFAVGKGFVIEQNNFIGFDVSADEVGISIAGTEDTTAVGMIRNNFFAYIVAAAITADKISQGVINNYVGDRGTGGTLVDSGTA